MEPWTIEKVRKSQAAHGVSVVEVRRDGEKWSVVRPSPRAFRVTAATPIRIGGPAAGHPWLQTAADPTGRAALGTLNNCASGPTPWGTYLTCEENFNGYFVNRSGAVPPLQKRYGINERGFGYRWHEHDVRFDAAAHPNEPNRFGWVVEVDPYDPGATPVKRTALGRFKHEGATVRLAADRRAVVYMGDDERFEYIYKFVSRHPWDPGMGRAAGLRLLDEGTLWVAHFHPDGSGEWRELAHGRSGLDAGAGFASQAEVLINARGAADRVGATAMDRPEWVAVHPDSGEVYCTLTNNTNRGKGAAPAADPANPRADNVFGHIVRWRERGGDAAATRFDWDVFVLCGNPALADAGKHGTIKGDVFGSPDGLWFDRRGVLWIQTDVSTSALGKGDYASSGEQSDAGGGSRHARGATVSHRTERRRGDGGGDDTGWDHHVREHPAPRRDRERAEQSRRAQGGECLARWRRGRAAALGHGRDSKDGRGHHRRVSTHQGGFRHDDQVPRLAYPSPLHRYVRGRRGLARSTLPTRPRAVRPDVGPHAAWAALRRPER